MIFQKINSISNFAHYSYTTFENELKHDLILYFDEKYHFFVLNAQNLEILFSKALSSLWSVCYRGNEIFLLENLTTLYKVCLDKNRIDICYSGKIIPEYRTGLDVLEGNFIIENQTKYENYAAVDSISKIVDLNLNKVVYEWQNCGYIIHLEGDFGYYQSFEKQKDSMFCIHHPTRKKLWEINLDSGADGKRILAQSDGVFFVHRVVSANQDRNILAISKLTGEILWEINGAFIAYNFDPKSNRIFGLEGNKYEMIQGNTGKRELVKSIEENIWVFSHLTTYHDGVLYFSGFINQNTPVLGGINTENGNIEFLQQVHLPGEKSFRTGLGKPVISGKRMYVLDSYKCLHIFERENV